MLIHGAENPSQLSDEQRNAYGIVSKLPRSLDESVAALETDLVLKKELGGSITTDFMAMKRAEQKMLEAMTEDDRRVWLIERY